MMIEPDEDSDVDGDDGGEADGDDGDREEDEDGGEGNGDVMMVVRMVVTM